MLNRDQRALSEELADLPSLRIASLSAGAIIGEMACAADLEHRGRTV